jgi:hypothetical protein
MTKKGKPHPNSLKNLRPPWQKGDVPNPKRINRKRPITDRYFGRAEDPLPEKIREKLKLEEGAKFCITTTGTEHSPTFQPPPAWVSRRQVLPEVWQ